MTRIFWKKRSKLRHCGRNYQLKRKLDGKSIVNFVHNFPPQNHYCPPNRLVIPLLYILIKYRASLVCCLLVYYCCPHKLRIVDKSNFQNGPAHEIDVPTSGFRAGVLADIGTLEMLVYNLKSMGNFVSLNMSFTVADIVNWIETKARWKIDR